MDHLLALWSLDPWGDTRDDLRHKRMAQIHAATGWGVEVGDEELDYLSDWVNAAAKPAEVPNGEATFENILDIFGAVPE